MHHRHTRWSSICKNMNHIVGFRFNFGGYSHLMPPIALVCHISVGYHLEFPCCYIFFLLRTSSSITWTCIVRKQASAMHRQDFGKKNGTIMVLWNSTTPNRKPKTNDEPFGNGNVFQMYLFPCGLLQRNSPLTLPLGQIESTHATSSWAPTMHFSTYHIPFNFNESHNKYYGPW